MPSREIITLQLGNYANFVGAHFWNFQDELLGIAQGENQEAAYAAEFDSDILFRTGENRQGGPSYSPRVLSVDLRGGSGAMRLQGQDLTMMMMQPGGNTPPYITSWQGGGVSTHVSTAIPRTKFVEALYTEQEEEEDLRQEEEEAEEDQTALDDFHPDPMAEAAAELEEEVKYWTDFLKVDMPPRSVMELPGCWLQGGGTPFQGFGDGAAVMENSELADEMTDRIRYFLEECDHLQGFQVFSEDCTGFGAVTAELLTSVCDDYPGRPILLYSLKDEEDSAADSADMARLRVSQALASARLADLATLRVPLHQNDLTSLLHSTNLNISQEGSRSRRRYHTSGVYAAALEAASTPYRLRKGGATVISADARQSFHTPPATGVCSLGELVEVLRSGGGPPLASLSLALPAPHLPAPAPPTSSPSHQEDPRCNPRTPHATSPSLTASLVSLTEGMVACSSDPRARSLTLRGAQHCPPQLPTSSSASMARLALSTSAATSSRQVSPEVALQALNAELRGRPFCLSHGCTTAQPLPIPLSFPPLFSSQASPSTSTDESEIVSAPVLSQLEASRDFSSWLARQLQELEAGGRTREGHAVLHSWDVGRPEIEEIVQNMHMLINQDKDDDFSD